MAEAADNDGTTRGSARRARRPRTAGRRQARRAGLLLAALPVLAGLLQLPGAEHAQAASGSRTVEVSVSELSPALPTEDDTVTVSGRLLNRGEERISGARVALRMTGAPMESRTAIARSAERTAFSWQQDGYELDGAGSRRIDGGLPPGIAVPFTLRVPAEELRTDGAGVYQLTVSVSGATAANPTESVLGLQHAFLPWQTGERGTKTGLTYLWPLISQPQLTARTDPDKAQTPYFRSDALERELRPGGRLQVLLDQGMDLPVTWVVDPDLLASVNAMTSPYWVLGADGRTRTPGSRENRERAKAWLAGLQSAVQGREVVALPYADTDLASVAHRAEGASTTRKQLREAVQLSRVTVESVLGVPARSDFAWPVDGAIDPAIVQTAADAGANKIIARSDSLRERTDLTYTPSAARPIGGGRTAVVADAGLSRLFEGDMLDAGKSARAVQQFLAQTLMVTLEAPNRQRSIVVAPQRTPTAAQAQTMATALRSLSQQRWTSPQDLTAAAKAPADPQAATTVPGAGSYPAKLRRQELGTATFTGIRQAQQQVDDFQVILTDPERVTVPIGNSIKRELSTEWRGNPNGAKHYREAVVDELTELTGSVRLIDKTDLTLSGHSGTLPVTVQNNLAQDVKGLKVRLTSSNNLGLQVSEDQVVSVPGGHSTSVKFDTTANASGTYTITAQLFTADDRPVGGAKAFRVEVTSITSTVLLVIGVGILLVVLAGVRMYTQRKRAAAQDPADGAPGGKDAGTGGDDTGPAPGAPTAPGEKVDR
ncbi:DUF6049 family protein [Streptomyces polyrhachis]|uniref:DUF6049 family protein n=1 Tax=Streptomyces polyrhachis TaxID=1282885 RepID=A0ABW2G8P6_9ACTN